MTPAMQQWIEQLLSSVGVASPTEQQVSRTYNIARTQAKGIRDTFEARENFAKHEQLGGVGLSPEQSDQIARAIAGFVDQGQLVPEQFVTQPVEQAPATRPQQPALEHQPRPQPQHMRPAPDPTPTPEPVAQQVAPQQPQQPSLRTEPVEQVREYMQPIQPKQPAPQPQKPVDQAIPDAKELTPETIQPVQDIARISTPPEKPRETRPQAPKRERKHEPKVVAPKPIQKPIEKTPQPEIVAPVPVIAPVAPKPQPKPKLVAKKQQSTLKPVPKPQPTPKPQPAPKLTPKPQPKQPFPQEGVVYDRATPTPTEAQEQVSDKTTQQQAPGNILLSLDDVRGMSVERLREEGKKDELILEKWYQDIMTLMGASSIERADVIAAWQQSPLYQLYLYMAQQGLEAGESIATVADTLKKTNKPYLEPNEFQAIAIFNSRWL